MGENETRAEFVRWPIHPEGPEKHPRITAHVLPEIHTAFELELVRLREILPWVTKAEGATNRVNRTDVVNWVWAAFVAQPPETREQIVAYGRALCEERQRSDKPVPIPAEGLPDSFCRAHSVPDQGTGLPRSGRGVEGLPGYRQSPRKGRDRRKGENPASGGANHAPRR